MKLIKRITALALAAVTAGAIGLNAAAEVEEMEAEPIELEVYCPTNEDTDFPFKIELDIIQSSIQYVSLDEPIYGFESVLDKEKLKFDMIFSLKSDYDLFENYKMNVFSSDYALSFFSGEANANGKIVISDLKVGETYKFDSQLNNSLLSVEFSGSLTVAAELNSSLTVDLSYLNSANTGDISTHATKVYTESEFNDKKGWADYIENGAIMKGSISTSSDVDMFFFTTPKEDAGGMGCIDISLSAPADTNLKINVYRADGEGSPKHYIKVDKHCIYYQIKNVPANTKYYVEITHMPGDVNHEYNLIVNRTIQKAWFGQYNSSYNNIDYWNSYKLDTLSIRANSEELPFFIDNANDDVDYWMRKGCGIAASAMILRNMGKTMLGYDYRTDFYGNMPADPFTVMLANCKLNGTTMTTDTTFLNTGSQYPNSLTIANVCNGFKVSFQYLTDTSEASLKKAVEDYGYVLIRFSKIISGKKCYHFMVITGFTTGDSLADRMLVLDPAASCYATGAGYDGNGVRLSKTASGFADLNGVVIENARVYK